MGYLASGTGVETMKSKLSITAVMAIAAVALAVMIAPANSHAIEVKKELNMGGGSEGSERPVSAGPSMRNPLTSAQQKALQSAVAEDSDSFLDEESTKKVNGEPYIDLEHASFSYIPANKGGALTVAAKLTGSEYKRAKGSEGRGRPTGQKKALVFNYKLEGGKFVATEPAKWEDVATASAKK